MIEIRANHSQVGMSIEARIDGGNWQLVQLTKYKERNKPNFGSYRSTVIDPTRDEAEYFESLDARGIKYNRVRE